MSACTPTRRRVCGGSPRKGPISGHVPGRGHVEQEKSSTATLEIQGRINNKAAFAIIVMLYNTI